MPMHPLVGHWDARRRLSRADLSRRRRGYNHLALRVDEIAAATAHLEANGVTMLSDEMDYISRRLRFFEGPEGITLGLVEWVGDDG